MHWHCPFLPAFRRNDVFDTTPGRDAQKYQSRKLFWDEHTDPPSYSSLQASGISCGFLLQMEGKRIQGTRSPAVQGTWLTVFQNFQRFFHSCRTHFWVFELNNLLGLPCSFWEPSFLCETLPLSVWGWGIVEQVQPEHEASQGQLFQEEASRSWKRLLCLAVNTSVFLFFYSPFPSSFPEKNLRIMISNNINSKIWELPRNE